MSPAWCQVIFWTNDGQVNWCIYASLGLSEWTHVCDEQIKVYVNRIIQYEKRSLLPFSSEANLVQANMVIRCWGELQGILGRLLVTMEIGTCQQFLSLSLHSGSDCCLSVVLGWIQSLNITLAGPSYWIQNGLRVHLTHDFGLKIKIL